MHSISIGLFTNTKGNPAALGPLARQKNGIITPAPLLDTTTATYKQLDQMIPPSFSQGFTAVVVGGHSPNCRWYSEDAVNLADNIKVKRGLLLNHVRRAHTLYPAAIAYGPAPP